MIADELIDFVVGEVEELFQAGAVGLYEFLEILRNPAPELSFEDACEIAQAALPKLLARGARMEWHLWDDFGYRRPADDAVPRDVDWRIPTDEPYLVVIPENY